MDYLVILVGVLLAWASFHGLHWLAAKYKKPLPPGPFSLPLIGNLHNILFSGVPTHQSLGRLAHKYGPIMSLKLGLKTTVVISSSAVAKEAFKTHDLALSSKTVKHALEAQNHHEFSVIFLPADSARRRNMRKLLDSYIFSGTKIEASQHLRSRKIQQLIDYCRRCSKTGEAVDVGQAASGTAVNFLSNTIFSVDFVDLCADSVKKFRHVVRSLTHHMGLINLADYFPLLKKIDPQRIKRRHFNSHEKMFGILGGFIDQRVEQRRNSTTKMSEDLLDVLLNMSEEDANGVDRNLIEHLFLDVFVAGTDTSSALLEWAMLELMKNPDVMEKAKAKLAQVVGKSEAVSDVDLARLPYLHCILKETLRIHPPSPLLVRKAEQDVEVCGYLVPKGSQVLVNVWAIHRDPAIWDDPLVFKPERFWGLNNTDIGRDQNFELIPFGVGRRRCAGLPLAVRTVPAMLGSLLNSFDWIVEDDNAASKDHLIVDEKVGHILTKSRPLRLVPISL